MKRICLSLSLIALATTLGCDKSGSPGGPGATAPGGKAPMMGQTDDTFNLTTSSMTVKQGETTDGVIGIKRGTNFSQNVAIAFTDLPAGVSMDPASGSIKSDSNEAKFTLAASDNAMPGEYLVKLTGHPGKGVDASNDFKLTVGKKDTFTLSMPFWTTALKQGEAKAVTLSIKRDKKFDQDVTLKFDSLPKGVTMEPSTAVIKNGETEAKFVMKAAEEAALGDFTIQATGHPTRGADATHDFKFSVAKK